MLWSIDSCKNRVSADQYHLPHRGLRYRPIEVEYFLKLFADKLLVFKWSKAQVPFFKIHMKYVVFEICHFGPALLRFWFQTDLAREDSASYLKIQAAKTFSYHGHALVTMFRLFKIRQVVYAASWNLFTLTAESDIVLCQLVTFLTVFFHWMYKMKYSCYQESFVIHDWFVIGFLVVKCVACQSRKSERV